MHLVLIVATLFALPLASVARADEIDDAQELLHTEKHAEGVAQMKQVVRAAQGKL